jgi:hypothetical protein
MHKKTEQQLRRRRYYLHRKIKGFARLKAAARIAFIAAADAAGSNKQLSCLYELRDRFGYSIQLEIT